MLHTKRLECFIRSLAITPGQLVAPKNQRRIEHVTEELWRNYNTRTRSWAVTSSSGFSAFPSRRSSSCIWWACCIDNASCAMTYRLAEATRWLRTHPWLGYAVGLGIFAFGFLLRFAGGGLLDDVSFITLFSLSWSQPCWVGFMLA